MLLQSLPLLLTLCLCLYSLATAQLRADPHIILAPPFSSVTFTFRDDSLPYCNYALQHYGRSLASSFPAHIQYTHFPCAIFLHVTVTPSTIGSYSCLGSLANGTRFNQTVYLFSSYSASYLPVPSLLASWLYRYPPYSKDPCAVRYVRCRRPSPVNTLKCLWSFDRLIGHCEGGSKISPLPHHHIHQRASPSHDQRRHDQPPLSPSRRLRNIAWTITDAQPATPTAPRTILQASSPRQHFPRPRRSLPSIPNNQHRPANYTWTIIDFQGNTLYSISNRTLWPWFPTLYFDFAEMLVGAHGFKRKTKCDPSPREVWNIGPGLYICPGYITDLSHIDECGTISDWYCKSWQCVSTGKIWWTAPYTTDYIKAGLEPDSNLPWSSCSNWACCGVRLNPMYVTFTSHGKRLPIAAWLAGKKWGGRCNDHRQQGNIFIIRLTISLEVSPPVGPNQYNNSPFLQPFPKETNPLITLVSSTHDALAAAHAFPDNDTKCWLCLSSQPPFYEAVGSPSPFANSTSDATCRWSNSSITIFSIEGQGCCLGYVPSNYSHYCINASSDAYTSCMLFLPNERTGLPYGGKGWSIMYTHSATADLSERFKGQFFIPSNGSTWACSTGATACVSGDILHAQKAFCIQVYLLPKMSVFSDNDFISRMGPPQYFSRAKREIFTTVTVAILLGLGATGAATGITGLVLNDRKISKLSTEIDADLKRIEQSMVALQNSLTSLSEVVLQNRRGLDLLFLKSGGLCVALNEECCFYTDSSGIVLDSMAELNKRLKDRERERSQHYTWYQGMFNFSPWLTTLLSAIAGPLILLLLACAIGPCVIGKLLNFLQQRLSSISDDILLMKHTADSECKHPLLEFTFDEPPHQHSSQGTLTSAQEVSKDFSFST